MNKATANKKRRQYAAEGPENDPVVEQMKEAGAFVRDYDRAYMPVRYRPDDDGYIDVELGWAHVAEFIHGQICKTDNRKVLMRLTLGDLASFYARAAGGFHDPLDPHDEGIEYGTCKECGRRGKHISPDTSMKCPACYFRDHNR